MEVMAHIKLSREMGAAYALLPGDPERVGRIASYLEDVEELQYNREYKSIRGRYQGVRVLAVSTGIGGASTGIAVEELASIGVNYMIRVGSCGALQRGIQLGDLILVNGAVRDDGASKTYIDPIYPAIPDFGLLKACEEAAGELSAAYHVGIARSHDSFYTDKEEEIDTYWSERGVLGADMETAALFTIGALRKVKTASILNNIVIYGESLEDNINSYTNGETAMMKGEKNEILTALEAFVRIENSKI